MQDEITLSGNQLKSLLFASDDLIPADSILSMYILQKEDAAFSGSDEGLTSDRANKTEELELELNQYLSNFSTFQRSLWFMQILFWKSPASDFRRKILIMLNIPGT